jgi:Conjugal transfer protein TraD
MRKVRDYDAELKALSDKARLIKARKVEQLGALVAATGADALDAETLAGVLLDALESSDEKAKEAWASKGAAFFQRRARKTVGGVGNKRTGVGEERGGEATG